MESSRCNKQSYPTREAAHHALQALRRKTPNKGGKRRNRRRRECRVHICWWHGPDPVFHTTSQRAPQNKRLRKAKYERYYDDPYDPDYWQWGLS